MWAIKRDASSVSFDVLVTPRASRARLGPVVEGRLKIAVTAPPVEGEANAAVIAYLAKSLGVPRARVSILRGDGSRRKSVRVEGLSAAEMASVMATLASLE
jgi:uncharacterized protein (TIGR00251 family)